MFFEYAPGKIALKVSSGKDRFEVSKDKMMRCFFNRNTILDAKINDDTFGPIVGLLVRSSIQRPNTEILIKAEKSFADFVKTIIDTVNKSKQEKIQILEEKPDEMTENGPSEYPQALCAENIEMYREQLKNFSETFEDAIESSNVLLKTSFPKTMWGAKELKGSLSKMRTASYEISNGKETFEGAAEQSDIRLSHIASCLFDGIKLNKNMQKIRYIIS